MYNVKLLDSYREPDTRMSIEFRRKAKAANKLKLAINKVNRENEAKKG